MFSTDWHKARKKVKKKTRKKNLIKKWPVIPGVYRLLRIAKVATPAPSVVETKNYFYLRFHGFSLFIRLHKMISQSVFMSVATWT